MRFRPAALLAVSAVVVGSVTLGCSSESDGAARGEGTAADTQPGESPRGEATTPRSPGTGSGSDAAGADVPDASDPSTSATTSTSGSTPPVGSGSAPMPGDSTDGAAPGDPTGAALPPSPPWGTNPPEEGVFDPEALHVIHLDLPPASRSALASDPFTYQPGRFRYGDLVLDPIGVRLKGSTSFRSLQSGKAAFKLKFDAYVDDQTFQGLHRLTLNNAVQDSSLLAERISYFFLREAGIAAPRCSSARVFVNGVDQGVYVNVESIDRTFLERRFARAPGNLYDITQTIVSITPGNESRFELETNESRNDTSDLTELMAALAAPVATFVERAEPRLDLDRVLALGAALAIVADWDGYFGYSNNYKLYHDLDVDRFILFPWGLDQTLVGTEFETDADYDIYHRDTSPFHKGHILQRCLCRSDCMQRYREAVTRMVEVFESIDLSTRLDRYAGQIAPYVREGRFSESVAARRAFLLERPSHVRAQLAAPLPALSCDD